MQLPFNILAQPTETTCGPTCLHGIYCYYGDTISLDQVISEVQTLSQCGTLSVFLACHALKRGYRATIYSYNIQLFDPTWFTENSSIDICDKLIKQSEFKSDLRLQQGTNGYVEFLSLGGVLRFNDFNHELIYHFLKQKTPVIAGLSATYLYRSARETGNDVCCFDDLRGSSCGHFVVVHGYDCKNGSVSLADPLCHNPFSNNRNYQIRIERLACALLLGVLTYDGDLLIIEKM